MKHLNKLFLAACVALTGCATTLPRSNVEIPAALTQPCEPLEELAGITGKDLLTNITDNAAIHWRCVDKYNALIEATKNKK